MRNALWMILLALVAFACGESTRPERTDAQKDLREMPDLGEDEVDDDAKRMLLSMSAKLAGFERFAFAANATQEEVLATGMKLQVHSTVHYEVERPGKFRAEFKGADDDRLLVYDGSSVTLIDRAKKFYGTQKAPQTIDATIDMLARELEFTLPLSDLLFGDAAKVLLENAREGSYVGVEQVNGAKAHHLFFSQEGLDWQIWIADATNLPVRLVLTYVNFEGAPQYTANFTDWGIASEFPADHFSRPDPAGFDLIEFYTPEGEG